jgi:hypothetical protein
MKKFLLPLYLLSFIILILGCGEDYDQHIEGGFVVIDQGITTDFEPLQSVSYVYESEETKRLQLFSIPMSNNNLMIEVLDESDNLLVSQKTFKPNHEFYVVYDFIPGIYKIKLTNLTEEKQSIPWNLVEDEGHNFDSLFVGETDLDSFRSSKTYVLYAPVDGIYYINSITYANLSATLFNDENEEIAFDVNSYDGSNFFISTSLEKGYYRLFIDTVEGLSSQIPVYIEFRNVQPEPVKLLTNTNSIIETVPAGGLVSFNIEVDKDGLYQMIADIDDLFDYYFFEAKEDRSSVVSQGIREPLSYNLRFKANTRYVFIVYNRLLDEDITFSLELSWSDD